MAWLGKNLRFEWKSSVFRHVEFEMTISISYGLLKTAKLGNFFDNFVSLEVVIGFIKLRNYNKFFNSSRKES